MKIALVSDIHANPEALNVVLDDIKKQEITSIFCLGDIIGYGPQPQACLEKIRETAAVVIMGNHEESIVSESAQDSNMNEFAAEARRITKQMLSKRDLEFIISLPLVYDSDEFDMTLAHGSTESSWDYIYSIQEAHIALVNSNKRTLCVGHTHKPFVFSREGGFLPLPDGQITLMANTRYVINAGSVGQPRDANPKSCYVIAEIINGIVKIIFRRLEYDISHTQMEMELIGFPQPLWSRLSYGL